MEKVVVRFLLNLLNYGLLILFISLVILMIFGGWRGVRIGWWMCLVGIGFFMVFLKDVLCLGNFDCFGWGC